MTNKIIISANPGGISNRLKCLISMWRISDKFDGKLYLYWIKNHTCGANFSDLFENDFKKVTKEQLERLPKKKYTLSETFRFIPIGDEISNGFAKVSPTKRGNNIDFEFERIPKEVRENILVYLKQIKPIEKIRKMVDYLSKKYDVENLVGVHVRRDDFMIGKERLGEVSSDNRFFKKMKEILSFSPSTKFLLCTDCQETENKFKREFGNMVIIYPKKNRDRTTVLNTQQGLIDLLLLSKTKHIIGTYRSTFNELAWWFGGCKAKVDIIIDDNKKETYESNQKKADKSILLKLKRVAYKLFTKLRLFKK